MMRKFLLIIRKLIDILLDESPGELVDQQKVTVVGDNNIIINGNNNLTNLMLPKNQNKVKHFPSEKSGKLQLV